MKFINVELRPLSCLRSFHLDEFDAARYSHHHVFWGSYWQFRLRRFLIGFLIIMNEI